MKSNLEIDEMFDERFLKHLEHHRFEIDVDTLGVPLIPNEIKSFIHLLRENDRSLLKSEIEGKMWSELIISPEKRQLVKEHNQTLTDLKAFLSSNHKEK